MPFNIESGYAIASNVDTPMQGLFCANAIPFTHATPMRTPVKEPGPAETANKSISSKLVFVWINTC